MTEKNRLETILRMLLKQKTGSLEPPTTTYNDRIENLARHLAGEGVIVLVGNVQPAQQGRNLHIRHWMSKFAELYYLFSYSIFETADEPVAYLADNQYPLVVVFEAKMLIVVRVLTDMVIPYIALRQSDGRASRTELRGMVDTILEELGATDLRRETYQWVRAKGIEYMEALLKSEIKQISLTNFSRDFLIQSGMQPSAGNHPARPDSLPELPEQRVNKKMTRPRAQPNNIIPLPPLDTDDIPAPPILNQNGLLGRLNLHPGNM